MAGTLEYEQLNKNLEVVDGHAVKAPEDYQDPEQLYQALVARVRKYHPSTDISMIEKAYRIRMELFTQFSHELRTPLTLISDPVENILSDDSLPEKFRYPVQQISRNAKGAVVRCAVIIIAAFPDAMACTALS